MSIREGEKLKNGTTPRSVGCELSMDTFRIEIRKRFLTIKGVMFWNCFSSRVMRCFKIELNMFKEEMV